MSCQVLNIQSLLGTKWTFLLLQELFHQPATSFNRLRERFPGITNKVLADRLHRMEQHGIVTKESSSHRALYTLTSSGKEFIESLNQLKEWGIKQNLVPDTCTATNCNRCIHKCATVI